MNRYGMMMSVQVLESSLNQAWDNPRPSSIGHDIHRASAWNRVIALHLQPRLARVFGSVHYAEDAEDMKIVERVLNNALTRYINNLDGQKVDELKEMLCGKLSDDAKLHAQGCAAFYEPGLARRTFPEIFDMLDKDGLVPLSRLTCVAPGVFKEKNLLLFAHPFFRRSLSRFNTLNDPFLERLVSTAEDTNLDVRIALDEDLVGHPATLLKNIELQYWWGPKFSDHLGEIRIGVTRHEASHTERFFNAISSTEFWWYEQDSRKTFECEEIRDLDVPSMGKSSTEFGCRFIHSILQAGTDQSVHLDGAVRLYDEDLMLARVDEDIMHFGRRAEYTKLWWIDGLLPVEVWKALINDYYRDNHLVGEYFGGIEEGEEENRSKIVDADEGLSIYKLVPATMGSGDGIRISISYHEHSPNTAIRAIEPLNYYKSGDVQTNYVEACTVEFVKLAKRRGQDVTFSSEIAVVAFEDTASNLALIEHCGSDCVRDAQISLEIIRDYCLSLKRSEGNRLIAFHISVRFSDRDVHFSFSGHVDDICDWLHSGQSCLPQSIEGIGMWADAAYEWITANFPKARDVPPMENMIKTSGLLTIDRKFLSLGEFEFVDAKRWPPIISLVRCPTIERVMPQIRENALVTAMAFIIKSSECSKCHNSYRDCNCIKLVDDDVIQNITDAELLGVFWTDRAAWDIKVVDRLPND